MSWIMDRMLIRRIQSGDARAFRGLRALYRLRRMRRFREYIEVMDLVRQVGDREIELRVTEAIVDAELERARRAFEDAGIYPAW